MKTAMLTYEQCPMTGEAGLILEGVKCDDLFAATEGILIAHDVLEHDGPETIGTVGGELGKRPASTTSLSSVQVTSITLCNNV